MDRKSALRWLNEGIGKYRIYICMIAVFQVVLGVLNVSFALLLKEVIDAAIKVEVPTLKHFLLLMVVLIILQILLSVYVKYLTEESSATLENLYKQRVFRGLLYKDYAQLQEVHSGEWMNRLTSDASVCASGMVSILPSAIGMLTRMIGAAVALLLLEPKFLWVMLPAGILILSGTYAFRKMMKSLHKKVQETDGRLRSFLQEYLGSAMVVRAFTAEEQTAAQAESRMAAHKAARMTKNSFSILCNTGFSLAMNSIYLLAIGYCAYGIMRGHLTYGTFMAVLQLIGQIQAPFAGITGILPRFYAMTASAERLMEAEQNRFATMETSEYDYVSKEEIEDFYQKEFEALCLEDVTFSYQKDGEESILRHFDLEIKKQQFVALTGHSGCGKSTLFKLLLDLYSVESGSICLRCVDGSRRELDRKWRRLFAYVPQENHLMSGTVREMIVFSDRDRNREEEAIRKALQIACAEEFVDALEQGLETVLGERGQGLSEGQMQRIAIARAIFADCPILLLDEATSALDEETERQVLQNLRELTDKTVLIVTHRPEALKICDRRVELESTGMR